MLVEIILRLDDGTVVTRHIGHALELSGWESHIADGPVVEGGHKLWGFTYLPVPPPRDPADMAEFRRLVKMYWSGTEEPA